MGVAEGFNEGALVGRLVGLFLGAVVALNGALVATVAIVTGADDRDRDGAADRVRLGCT